MGRHDHRPVRLPLHDVPQHLPLRRHVKRTRRLVEKQDRCAGNDRPRDAETLGLPGGKSPAVLSHLRLKSARLSGDEIPGAGHFQRFDELLIGRIFIDHAQVLRDGSGQDRICLGHVGKEMARVCICLNLLSAGFDCDLTFIRPDQAEHQPDHGRFALARRPDQRDDLARIRDEIRVRDDLLILHISKIHIVHADREALVDIRVHLAALRDVNLLGQLNKLADTVRRHRALQKCRDDPDKAVECARKRRPLLQEQRHRTVCDRMPPQKEQAVAECDQLDCRSEKRQEYVRLDLEHIVLERDFLELLLPAPQLSAVLARDAEALDRIKIVKCLHLKAHHLGGHFLDLLAVLPLLGDQIMRRKH